MKTKINKIMGVFVATTVLLSMLVANAIPAKAATLAWSTESVPGAVGNVISTFLGPPAGGTPVQVAVSADGKTIYAVNGTNSFRKSTNAGATWTTLSLPNPDGIAANADDVLGSFVAVAPDDPNVVAIVDNVTTLVAPAPTSNIWLSTSGGATAGSFNALALSQVAAAAFTSVALGPSVGGIRQLAVAGADAGGLAQVSAFGLGGFAGWVDMTGPSLTVAASPGWGTTVLGGLTVGSRVAAIAFSPNFTADRIITAVSVDTLGATGGVFFNIGSFATTEWNAAAGFPDYSGLTNSTGLITPAAPAPQTLVSADISLAPTFAGADPGSRIAFVALDTGAAATSGVFRMDDSVRTLRSASLQFRSVSYNGTDLVAGASATAPAVTNAVYRTDAPLANTPSMVQATSNQRPSGGPFVTTAINPVVRWAGTDVLALTTGDEAAASVSKDKGATFNDVSLINTAVTNIQDIAVAPDGSKWFMTSDDGADVSFWRKTGTTWERIQSLADIVAPATVSHVVRMAPENASVVFFANTGAAATNIYYTDDNGEKIFNTRVTTDAGTVDVASESATVIYAITGNAIRKSTDAGFLWSDPAVSLGFTAPEVAANLKVLSKDNLLIGSTGGKVARSTDAGATWSRTGNIPVVGIVQATANGLATGNFIFAASDAAGSAIYRIPATFTGASTWDTLTIPGTAHDPTVPAVPAPIPATRTFVGLEFIGGILYGTATAAPWVAGVPPAVDAGGPSFLIRSANPVVAAASSVTFSGVVSPAGANFATGGAPINARTTNLESSTGGKIWAASVNTSATSGSDAVFSFTDTATGATSVPKLVAPANNATINMNEVSGLSPAVPLTWERAAEATSYEVQIAFDQNFNQIIAANGLVGGIVANPVAPADPAATPVGVVVPAGALNANQTYYWRVRVLTPLAGAFPATPNTIKIGPATGPTPTAPVVGSPTLTAPAPGATNVPRRPTFQWEAVAGANSYEIQVDKDPNFGAPVARNNSVFSNVFVPTVDLDANTVYYWRVRATSGTTTGPYANGVFTTAAPPPPPTTVAPTQPPPPPVTITTVAPPPVTTPAYVWAIIGIGALLVIAVLVLIMRTGRKG
jgi:hypothetical protein